MKVKIISIILITFFTLSAKAQDEIWLLNGEKKQVKNLEFSDDNLSIRYTNEKGKTKYISTSDLFSATPKGDKEYILFKPTPEMSIENMKEFMYGEIDAKTYIPKGSFWLGFAAGAASPFAFRQYAPVAPLGFGIVIGSINPKNDKLALQKNTKFYIEGYKKVAKRKRLISALKGGIAGLLVGYTGLYLKDL